MAQPAVYSGKVKSEGATSHPRRGRVLGVWQRLCFAATLHGLAATARDKAMQVAVIRFEKRIPSVPERGVFWLVFLPGSTAFNRSGGPRNGSYGTVDYVVAGTTFLLSRLPVFPAKNVFVFRQRSSP